MNDLKDFITPYSDIEWNPYITFGVNLAFYSNTLKSDLGDWRTNRKLLPEKYQPLDALKIGSGTALNFTVGLGTRYKLTKKIDLATQLQWQIFLTNADAIDGLQANVSENKNNELITSFQFGVIYHLNFNDPLFRNF